jgi:hypothetical protein
VIKIKFLSVLFLSSSLFLLINKSAYASLVTINPKGEVIWQVLGDSTLKVNSVAGSSSITNSEISLNNNNGKVELNGMDVTNSKETLINVESRPNSNNLKIRQDGGKFNIEENGITANTSFPISINPAKNELSVTTNSGTRVLAVLPYEATLSLMRAKLIDKVTQNKINLDESPDGVLEYEIDGTKNVNLFNVISINANVNSVVSAVSGVVIKVDEPQWLKFLGFLWK